MILNPIMCEECNMELQPEDVGVKINGGELVRVCGYCKHEVIIK